MEPNDARQEDGNDLEEIEQIDLQLPLAYFLARWPVTIPVACVIVAVWFIHKDVNVFGDAVVGIATARWGSAFWIAASLFLLLTNILTIIFSRYIIKGKDAVIANLEQLNAVLRERDGELKK